MFARESLSNSLNNTVVDLGAPGGDGGASCGATVCMSCVMPCVWWRRRHRGAPRCGAFGERPRIRPGTPASAGQLRRQRVPCFAWPESLGQIRRSGRTSHLVLDPTEERPDFDLLDVGEATLILLAALAGLYTVLILGASGHDLLARTIPDRLSLTLLVIALIYRSLDGDIRVSLICGAVWLAAALILFFIGWLGGGDAKLMPGAALMAAPTVPAQAGLIVWIVLYGGGLALLYILVGALLRSSARPRPAGRDAPLLRRWQRIEAWRLRRARTIPYAMAIAAGALTVIWR